MQFVTLSSIIRFLNLFNTELNSICHMLALLRTDHILHVSRIRDNSKCLVIELQNNFKDCKSVHHRTIQTNHQPDAKIFQFIILTFIYSSTCFGRFPAHHQELNDCSGILWFYLRIVVIVVLCSWSGR
jgi:hypothetical protein